MYLAVCLCILTFATSCTYLSGTRLYSSVIIITVRRPIVNKLDRVIGYIAFRQDMPATGIVNVVKKLAALTPQSAGARDDDAYQDEDRTTVIMARRYADTPNQWPQSDIPRVHNATTRERDEAPAIAVQAAYV